MYVHSTVVFWTLNAVTMTFSNTITVGESSSERSQVEDFCLKLVEIANIFAEKLYRFTYYC
jgi:hypothetical protein